jgi:hypothetical protein
MTVVKLRIAAFMILWLLVGLIQLFTLVYYQQAYKFTCSSGCGSPVADRLFFGVAILSLIFRFFVLRYVLGLRLKYWGLSTIFGIISGPIGTFIVGFSLIGLYVQIFQRSFLLETPFYSCLEYILFRFFVISSQYRAIHKHKSHWLIINFSSALLIFGGLALNSINLSDNIAVPDLPIAAMVIAEILVAYSYLEIKLREDSFLKQNGDRILKVY